MIEREIRTLYRVACDVCRRPAGAAWQCTADQAEADAEGSDDFHRFTRPVLWRGRRVVHICRGCWEVWEAEQWEQAKLQDQSLTALDRRRRAR